MKTSGVKVKMGKGKERNKVKVAEAKRTCLLFPFSYILDPTKLFEFVFGTVGVGIFQSPK